MDLTSHIGIAVSGCKNGYALLATDGIDSSSELLRTALRDLRGYLRVTEPGHDYFTMSVYRNTLVISACRSSVDAVGSSGGFIAVSLTVPASLSINRPAELLTALLNEYWGEFMHPMFGSPLPGKFEGAHRLRALLQTRATDVTQAKVRYRVHDFEGAQPPLFMGYNSEAEVNAVMSTPWHRAYSRGCKLIMLPAGMLSSPKVNYNIEVKKIAPQPGMPGNAIDLLLEPKGSPVRVSSYTVNAIPRSSMGDVSLNPDDMISYTLSMPDGKDKTFNGILRQAVERRLIRRDDDNYRINTPYMDVTLSITGTRPAQRCEYALSSAHGDVVSGQPDPSNPLLRVFHIKCDGFPYSLVEAQGGRERRMLCRNAVTKDNLRQQPVNVTAAPAKGKSSGFAGFAGRGHGDHSVKRSLPMPIIVAIAAVVVGLAGLGVWWLLPSEPEAQPANPGTGQSTTTQNDDNNKGTTGGEAELQEPKYTYLFIPVETIREAITKAGYDHLSSQAFPSGTGYYYDNETKITIIRIPEEEGLKPELGIHLEGKQEEDCGLLELNPTNMPQYDDLLNYRTSKQDRLLVRPADPDKQPSSELVQSFKTINLDDLTFKPLDTTPPTENVKQPAPQQNNNNAQPAKKDTKNNHKGGKGDNTRTNRNQTPSTEKAESQLHKRTNGK